MFNTIIILAGLIIGSLTDIKTREIPDALNFSLIGIGLLSGLLLSIFHSSSYYLANSFLGFLAGAIIGLLLFYTGQWGGGDAKMVMGIGALTGISLSEFSTGIPLFIVFIINSLLIGAFYGLIWVLALGLSKFREVRKEFKKVRETKQALLFRKLFILITIILVPLLFIIKTSFILKVAMITGLFFFFLSFHASMLLRSVEKAAMVKKIDVSKLTEGDWVVEEVKIENNKTFKPPKTGVSVKDIQMLKKNKVKKVAVKQGIPFVPSFLLAYIATLLLGNWLILIF